MLIVRLCRVQGFTAPDGLRDAPKRQIDLDLGLGARARGDARQDRPQMPVGGLRIDPQPGPLSVGSRSARAAASA